MPDSHKVPETDIWENLTDYFSLKQAWNKVEKNKGSSGGERVTLRAFARNLAVSLREISDNVREGEWQHGPCRRVDIPKKKGGFRRLFIPPIADRVLHAALAEALTPILEPHFEQSSFAYREGKSVQKAVRQIDIWRTAGYQHVIEADIVSYFDNVQHPLLLRKLKIYITDLVGGKEVLSLVKDLLAHFATELDTPGRGLVQGSPLSPLLANLYLDALDERIEAKGVKIVRFADDFVILCKSEVGAEKALEKAQQILVEHGLECHERGTGPANFADGFEFLGHLFLRSLIVKQSPKHHRRSCCPRQKPPFSNQGISPKSQITALAAARRSCMLSKMVGGSA